jgi:hypothetical protein
MPRWAISTLSLLALLGAGTVLGWSGTGCAGSSHHGTNFGPGEDGGPGSTVDGGTTTPAPTSLGITLFTAPCSSGTPTVDWSPIRRISRVEYNNSVRDLLGDTTQPATGFTPESQMTNGVNFLNNTYSSVSALIATQYIQAAETLGKTAAGNLTNVFAQNGVTSSCATMNDSCAQAFITAFATRAFRGQIDSTESMGLQNLYSTVKGMFDFPTAIQAVVEAVLESPRFLYVVELGDGTPNGNVVPLSQYEIAGRLALFLWRTVPDANLLQLAANNQLSTPAQIQAQAAQMLADPSGKAYDAINDFTTQWAMLQGTASESKDTVFTLWNMHTKLPQELVDETLTNVSQLVLTANGSLTTLLTSPMSYINSDLATFYGNGTAIALGTTKVTVNDPALSDTAFFQTMVPNRIGILTNGSILATQAHTALPSSVLRGKIVRENILCDVMPQPPPNVPPPPTNRPDGGTTRDLFVAHETIPGCVTCHQYMDPIGFGFLNFDATGAYQTTDANGQAPYNGVANPPTFPPIDASGQINPMNPGEFQTTFTGLNDLVTQLSQAPQTDQCFALNEFRYALSRMEDMNDACSAQQLYSAFSGSGFNIQKLLVAIVATDAFRYRSTVNAGSACQ